MARTSNMAWCLCLAFMLLFVPTTRAQCYLMDADAKCAVCWKTVYSDANDKVGVTKMSVCPDTIVETWTEPLPEKMTALQEYMVTYSIRVDPEKFEVAKQGDNHVPHANIHSCIASGGACTPFVSNSPGLSTHTEALIGSLDADGRGSFSSAVQLTEEQYTIIAHVRFYVKDKTAPDAPAIKYDVAIGASRVVARGEEAISADSWITTGIAGALLVIVVSSVVWAARSGRIDFDQIIETLYSDEVTCSSDILIGIGDTAAYTVGVFTVIAVDHRLVQVLPASFLFMAIAWIGSIYNAYYDVHQLWDVYLQKNYRARFFDTIAQRLAAKTVRAAVKHGKRASVSGIDVSADNAIDAMRLFEQSIIADSKLEANKQEATLEYEMAVRELRRKRGDVVTIFSESLPITIIQCYVLMIGEEVQTMTILIMLFSSVVFGAKLAGLGAYKTVRVHKDSMEARFMCVFNVVIDPSDPEELKRSRTLKSLTADSQLKRELTRRSSFKSLSIGGLNDNIAVGRDLSSAPKPNQVAPAPAGLASSFADNKERASGLHRVISSDAAARNADKNQMNHKWVMDDL